MLQVADAPFAVAQAFLSWDQESLDKIATQALAEGSDWKRYSNGDDWFAVWLFILDYHIRRRVGVSLFDMPDAPLRDYFDDGMRPIAAVIPLLRDWWSE